MDAFWIMLIGSLAAINCSLIGTYLVLRKAAMVGDAISHAVLPGLVMAFLLSGSRTTLVVLLGAGSVGLFATFLMEFLHKKARVQADASIGINFTWLFALGIILISLFGRRIDIDPDCILYGDIAYAPLDTLAGPWGIPLGPRAVYILAVMLLVNLGFILLSYKELAISTFDPAFATSIGMSTTLWHYMLMGATSFTTVAAFEMIGAILVVALLVAPPAAAYLITQRLPTMLVVASLLGILSAVGGYCLAVWVNGSIAGGMATVAGGIFSLIFLAQQRRPQRYRVVAKVIG